MIRKLKANYIPLIRSQGDLGIVNSVMKDADVVRMAADFADTAHVPSAWRLWLDPCFDGYEHIFTSGWYGTGPAGSWETWIRRFHGHELLTTEAGALAAPQGELDDFVARVLDAMAEGDPVIISVPQVPYTPGTERHGINRKLAKAAGTWKESHWTSGTFLLPVVLRHPDAYRTKAASDPKINAICRTLELSRATGVWVAHAEFDDLAGVANYDKDRFPSLISFHERLNESLPAKTTTSAGPYWAINLILWARGIVDVPVIGCGGTYRYYLPKPAPLIGKPMPRVAIPPLRRWYGVNQELRGWLKTARAKFPPRNETRESLQLIEASFAQFLGPAGRKPSMRQTAQFYHDWLQRIAAIEPRGRGLFLYQDFSSAVVTGSRIRTKLPKQRGLSADARDPGFIAQQFMLQCLPR